MKQFYSYFLLSFIVICLSVGCTHFDEPVMPEEAAQSVETRAAINAAALRASAGVANINNPYSVANMRKAMNQISAVYGTQPKPIYATHDYVRFLPKDSLDMYILEDSLRVASYRVPHRPNPDGCRMRVLQQRPDRRIWLALHACSQKLQISFGNRDRNFAGGICARQRVHHQDGRCGTYFASAHRRRQFRRHDARRQ